MKSVTVRQDYTVELPEEVRAAVHPGDSLEVIVTAGNVVQLRPPGASTFSFAELAERIRNNPPEEPMSEAEIEEIIHQVREERRREGRSRH